MNRRRFLTLSACALAAPAHADVVEWHGRGLGTALSLRLVGADPARAPRLFARIEAEVDRIESLFSLHRDSALTRLNRDGHLAWPGPDVLNLLDLARRVYLATAGAFDPTVQPLWRALATGGDLAPARALIGFDRVALSRAEVRLDRGQALTLNGIAQGWAADRIAALLRREGFSRALVDMGEIAALGTRAGGGPWQVGLLDDTRPIALSDRALATSALRGTIIGADMPHILNPHGQGALWQTVSVSAPQAAVADALSTAFCLMPAADIRVASQAFPGARVEKIA